jgi:hypothetical protein
MDHIVFGEKGGETGYYHHALFHKMIEGRHDFSESTFSDIIDFLKKGQHYTYYRAFSRTLRIMRDSEVEEGDVLPPLIGWSIHPRETTILICGMDHYEREWGHGETEIKLSPIVEVEEDPFVKEEEDAVIEIHRQVNVSSPPDKEFLLQNVIPAAQQLMRMWLNMEQDVPIHAYFEGVDLVGYLSMYYKLPIESVTGSADFERFLARPSTVVNFKDWIMGRAPDDIVIVWTSSTSLKIDKMLSKCPSQHLIVVSRVEAWFQSLAEHHVMGFGYHAYSHRVSVQWSRISKKTKGEIVFTDFFREDRTYRLVSKAHASLMLQHVYLGAQVKVSSLDSSLLRNFPIGCVRQIGAMDVALVGDGFDSSLPEFVSLISGRPYMRRIVPYQQKDLHLVEGAFVAVRSIDSGPFVQDENGVPFLHAVRSASITTIQRIGGVVRSIVRKKVFVYSAIIVTSPSWVHFQRKEYDKIPPVYLAK